MAQNNPIEQSASLSSTGNSNTPLNTSSSYGTADTRSTGQKIRDAVGGSGSGTTDHGSVNASGSGIGSGSGSTAQSETQRNIKEGASGIGGVFAGIHGIGEKVRGEFNTAVDGAFDESAGVQKNSAVARAGDSEMETGKFAGSTKNREGVVRGDGERRVYGS